MLGTSPVFTTTDISDGSGVVYDDTELDYHQLFYQNSCSSSVDVIDENLFFTDQDLMMIIGSDDSLVSSDEASSEPETLTGNDFSRELKSSAMSSLIIGEIQYIHVHFIFD